MNNICAISKLKIEDGEDIRVLLLNKNLHEQENKLNTCFHSLWYIRNFPIKSIYNKSILFNFQRVGIFEDLIFRSFKYDLLETGCGKMYLHEPQVMIDSIQNDLINGFFNGRVKVCSEKKFNYKVGNDENEKTINCCSVMLKLIRCGYNCFISEDKHWYSVECKKYGEATIYYHDKKSFHSKEESEIITNELNKIASLFINDEYDVKVINDCKSDNFCVHVSTKKTYHAEVVPVLPAIIKENVWQKLLSFKLKNKLFSFQNILSGIKKTFDDVKCIFDKKSSVLLTYAALCNLSCSDYLAEELNKDTKLFHNPYDSFIEFVMLDLSECDKEIFFKNVAEMLFIKKILKESGISLQPSYGSNFQPIEYKKSIKFLNAMSGIAKESIKNGI